MKDVISMADTLAKNPEPGLWQRASEAAAGLSCSYEAFEKMIGQVFQARLKIKKRFNRSLRRRRKRENIKKLKALPSGQNA